VSITVKGKAVVKRPEETLDQLQKTARTVELMINDQGIFISLPDVYI
jgi:hypothetical protein